MLSQIDLVVNSDHTSFALYNSDDLYLIFDRKLTTRDGSNAHGRQYWNVSSASIINNPNNVNLGTYVHTVIHSSASAIIFSNITSAPWCSPIHGRYNGGCGNGNYGIGAWSVYVK